MATGKVPFDADNLMGILTKHLYENPIPPHELPPPVDVPPALEAVILKCLTKKPELRYQTMAELLADLEAVEPGSRRRPWSTSVERSTHAGQSTPSDLSAPGRVTVGLGQPQRQAIPASASSDAAVDRRRVLRRARRRRSALLGEGAARSGRPATSSSPPEPRRRRRPPRAAPAPPPPAPEPAAAPKQVTIQQRAAGRRAVPGQRAARQHAVHAAKPKDGERIELELRLSGYESKAFSITRGHARRAEPDAREAAEAPPRADRAPRAATSGTGSRRSPRAGRRPRRGTRPKCSTPGIEPALTQRPLLDAPCRRTGPSDYCPHAMRRPRSRSEAYFEPCFALIGASVAAALACSAATSITRATCRRARRSTSRTRSRSRRHGPGAPARYLFVGNSNFDLRYKLGHAAGVFARRHRRRARDDCSEDPLTPIGLRDPPMPCSRTKAFISSFSTALGHLGPDGRPAVRRPRAPTTAWRSCASMPRPTATPCCDCGGEDRTATAVRASARPSTSHDRRGAASGRTTRWR